MITYFNKHIFVTSAKLYNVLDSGKNKTCQETLDDYTNLLNRCGFIKRHTNWVETEVGDLPEFGYKLEWYIPEDFSIKEARMWSKLDRQMPWFIHPEGRIEIDEEEDYLGHVG